MSINVVDLSQERYYNIVVDRLCRLKSIATHYASTIRNEFIWRYKMQEIWKDILGFENYYKVSNLGRIKSIDRWITGESGNMFFHKGKIIKQYIGRSGYFHLNLAKNKKQRTYDTHRIVCETFIENPENKKEVNHKNGIRTDNRVENLEWVSRSENITHRYRILGRKAYWKGKKVPLEIIKKRIAGKGGQ